MTDPRRIPVRPTIHKTSGRLLSDTVTWQQVCAFDMGWTQHVGQAVPVEVRVRTARGARSRHLSLRPEQVTMEVLQGSIPALDAHFHPNSRAAAGVYSPRLANGKQAVSHQSLFEARTLKVLDFCAAPIVVAQPFTMTYIEDGKTRRHTPDFAVVDRTAGLTLINCRPRDRMNLSQRLQTAALATALGPHGWAVAQVVGYRDYPMSAIAYLLAAHKARDLGGDLDRILASLSRGSASFGDLAEASQAPAAARGLLRALILDRTLSVDLASGISDSSRVSLSAASRAFAGVHQAQRPPSRGLPSLRRDHREARRGAPLEHVAELSDHRDAPGILPSRRWARPTLRVRPHHRTVTTGRSQRKRDRGPVAHRERHPGLQRTRHLR